MERIELEQLDPSVNDAELLLSFLLNRSCPCPECGYDLRNLTRPICPECGEELSLSVGRRHAKYGVLILTLSPGIFSGICGILLFAPMFYIVVIIAQGAILGPLLLDSFGLMSGLAALLLYRHRQIFVRLSNRSQLLWASMVWAVHFAAFIVLIANII